MASSPMYDPQTSEARSSWLAGLTEICNKLSGVLNMSTDSFVDLTLPELYISEEDRYRIYQAPLGNKLWLQSPAPVVKKNGITITPEMDGFEIDYLGGSIAFNDEYTLGPEDIITVDATYIVDNSQTIEYLRTQINDLAKRTGNYKGSFDTLDDLTSEYDTAEPGDYAIVEEYDTIYVWSGEQNKWVDVYKETDLSNYLTKTQIEGMLNLKESQISAQGSGTSADMYYYGGRKTWVSILDKILGATLSGLAATNAEQVNASDTLLIALGKLQAQINEGTKPLSGYGEPTLDTEGEIGQDYVDTSNGDKYHLTSKSGGVYTWTQYADTDYVERSIQSAIYSAFRKNY